jgi:hypothetical protein
VGVLAGVKAGLGVKAWVGVEAGPAVAACVGPAVPVSGELAAGTEAKVITGLGLGVEAVSETAMLGGEGARVGDATGVSTDIARTTGVGVLVATTVGLGVLVGVGVGRERAKALYPIISSSMMISLAVAMAIAKKTHPANEMPLRKLIGNCLSDNRSRQKRVPRSRARHEEKGTATTTSSVGNDFLMGLVSLLRPSARATSESEVPAVRRWQGGSVVLGLHHRPTILTLGILFKTKKADTHLTRYVKRPPGISHLFKAVSVCEASLGLSR